MTIDHEDDLEGLRRAGRAVAEARDAMLAAVAPGVSTAELDAVGREVLKRHGAKPAPPTVGFPAATCVSLNDEAAHGIPSPFRRLRAGDLVNVDVSAHVDGYFADTGASAPVGSVDPIARRLLQATKAANTDAVSAARAGRPLRHIGRAVQRQARRSGFSVIANLCGHGTGRDLWEPPQVPGVEDPSDDTVLWEGLVLAIEPFLATGATYAEEAADGWTLRTPGHLSAQFEHTVVVTNGAPLVLTASS
jgi:methionyl aminopeptidase